MELTKGWVAERLPVRPTGANKGAFGKVLVVAGSKFYMGAAYFVAAAAYRVGAGLVSLASTQKVVDFVIKKLPEVTLIPLPEEDGTISNLALDSLFEKLHEFKEDDVICIGSGLTKKPVQFVNEIFKLYDAPKMVIDGDGLNILSETSDWWENFERQGVEAILTPHPGEMSRLTELSVDEIQKNRAEIAKNFAKEWGQVIVLKGANTVVASPGSGEEILISPFANPALATAGTGDVLAGIVAGLAAQGLSPHEAAGVGVYIHGLAGELVAQKVGKAGSLASDLLPLLPQVIKDLL